jgi:dienelactone hydrolase
LSGKLVIDQAEVLADEPVRFVVAGCTPGELVTVTASWSAGAAKARTQARFVAPENGVVEPSSQPSVGGSYTGVEPYGLWWAAGSAAAASATQTLDSWPVGVTAAGDGWESSGSLVRVKMARSVRRVDVTDGGLRGIAFVPEGPGPFPAVLLFSGSGGGITTVQCTASLLASHGFAAFALAYFNYPDLPSELVDIPLEYFRAAIGWLTSNVPVAGGRVAVMGASRGGELALLLGSSYPGEVAAVVAMVPSGLVWAGLAKERVPGSVAWTRNGEPVQPLPGSSGDPEDPQYRDGAVVLTPSFEARIAQASAEELAAAEIPVELTNGPVLLLSAADDALWPSVALAEIAVRRAREHGAAHPIRHVSYPDAGHVFTRPAGFPISVSAVHPVTGELIAYGGSEVGNAHASASSWQEILTFLRASLPVSGLPVSGLPVSGLPASGLPASGDVE